jgi:hypothetical protein
MFSGINSIAAGFKHNLALKNDGTVWAWGKNNYGQLGDGTNVQRATPVQVTSLSNVTQIAAGEDFSLALKNDGTVWAWGWNQNGTLGTGNSTNHSTPFQVSALHTLALKNDGTLWAWGYNPNWNVSDTNLLVVNLPIEVTGFCSTVGISEFYFNTDEPLLFPNPAINELMVKSSKSGDKSMEVFDVMGMKCLALPLNPLKGTSASIDVSKLAPGIYFVKLRGENEERVAKFVKQ